MSAHKARKRFGQNFLIDAQIIHQIGSLFAKAPENPSLEHSTQTDHYQLIEIGPGKGALTHALLQHGQPLIALELDRDLIPILQDRFAQYSHFTLHSGDALQTDFKQLGQGKKLRLVGNLPYNVATPLIFNLLEDIEHIVDMHFMLQHEVVARLCAAPGSPHYGQLTVVVQNLCHTKALLHVPPTAFSPAPKVDSGFISITPRAQPIVEKPLQARFNQLVKTAFVHRRKTLRNNLKGTLDASQIEAQNIDPGARAETLSIEDYARLTAALDS